MSPPRSLRLRLLAGAGVWVGLALILSGIALASIFEANIEQRAREDLAATRNRLLAALTSAPDPNLLDATLTDPRYAIPFGGLYWLVEDTSTGERYRSRSLWDTTLSLPRPRAAESAGYATVDGPDGQRLLAFGGLVTLESPQGSSTYVVTVAQDRADTDRAVSRFGLEMGLDLLILGGALMLAAWIQVNLGLRPLTTLAAAIESIRAGRSERLGSDYPAEVLPLVGEINDLLAARDRSIELARSRAAELAHRLKTPIAVVSATSERLMAAGDRKNAATLAALSSEVTAEIDYQLRLAAMRPRDSVTVLRTSLNSVVLRTIAVLRKTTAGEALHWQVDLAEDALVDVDEHDLLELIGIVLENASKWAKSHVRVTTRTVDAVVEAVIADDGPGLTDEQIARLGVRGERPRQDKPGSGFGLAIALQIAAVNRGEVSFSRSDLGGLELTLHLPLVR